MVLFNVYIFIFLIPMIASQDIIFCGIPGTPFNGALTPIKDVYEVNEEVTYGCKEKRFYLIGNVRRTCSANGTWSGSIPICGNNIGFNDVIRGTKSDCNPKHLVDNNKKTFCRIENATTITLDLYVHFSFNTILFTVEPNTDYSLKVEVSNDYDKTKIKRLSVQNQFISNNFLKLVSKINMNAKTIKITFENNVTIYDISVFYIIDEELCVQPDTQNLVKFTNITSTKGKLSCPRNYVLDGEAHIHCINGEWNTTGQHCKLFEDVPEGWMGCGKPGSPANGKRLIEEILENKLIYSCNKNYHLIGNSERICQPNSFWTPQIPECVKNLAKNEIKTNENGATCTLQDTKSYGAIDLGKVTRINSIQLNLKTRYPIDFSVFVTNNSDIKLSTFDDVRSLTMFCNINNVLPKAPITCTGSAVSALYVATYYSKPVNVCEIIVFNTKDAECGQSDQPLHGKMSSQNQSTTTFVCDSGYSMNEPNVAKCEDGIWENPPLCSPIVFVATENNDTSYDNNTNVVLIIGISAAAAGICILIIILIVCRIKRRPNQNFENLSCHYKAGKGQDCESDETEHIYEAVKPPPVRTYTKQACTSNDVGYLTPILPLKRNNSFEKQPSKCKALEKQVSSKPRDGLCSKLSSGSNDFCKAQDNVYS